MGQSRVRLKDIANTTGFSVNTVSLALRGSARLPEKTREMILKEAERQNYFPNRIARSLVSRSTNTVGLILTDIMNPTITLAARTIEKQLAKAGYSIMFAASDNNFENEKRAINLFQSHQVDGILIYPSNRSDIEHIKAVHKSGLPILVLADILRSGIDMVAIDDRKGAHAAVSHLISRGHRTIAVLDGASGLGNQDKQEGALKALRDAGLDQSVVTVIDPSGSTAAHGYTAIAKAMELRQRPTAIFATTDSLAIGTVRWCQEHGVSIPGDLAIIGFDNTEASEFCSVPLTTINYAADDVSRQAVHRILEMIDNKGDPLAAISTLIEPELIIRQST